MQGFVDLSDCAWDEAEMTLSGVSKIVEGETYEVVLAVNGYKPTGATVKHVEASVADVEASIAADPDHLEIARLRLLSKKGNHDARWALRFEK